MARKLFAKSGGSAAAANGAANDNVEQMEIDYKYTEPPFAHLGGGSEPSNPNAAPMPTCRNEVSPKLNGLFEIKNSTDLYVLFRNENSQSIRNTISIYPHYLTPKGEYQEFLPTTFE